MSARSVVYAAADEGCYSLYISCRGETLPSTMHNRVWQWPLLGKLREKPKGHAMGTLDSECMEGLWTWCNNTLNVFSHWQAVSNCDSENFECTASCNWWWWSSSTLTLLVCENGLDCLKRLSVRLLTLALMYQYVRAQWFGCELLAGIVRIICVFAKRISRGDGFQVGSFNNKHSRTYCWALDYACNELT